MEVHILHNQDDISIKTSTKELPFEYKWLEYRLVLNQQLYDEKIINYEVYREMSDSLITRMKKIKTQNINDLTFNIKGGNMQAT